MAVKMHIFVIMSSLNCMKFKMVLAFIYPRAPYCFLLCPLSFLVFRPIAAFAAAGMGASGPPERRALPACCVHRRALSKGVLPCAGSSVSTASGVASDSWTCSKCQGWVVVVEGG